MDIAITFVCACRRALQARVYVGPVALLRWTPAPAFVPVNMHLVRQRSIPRLHCPIIIVLILGSLSSHPPKSPVLMYRNQECFLTICDQDQRRWIAVARSWKPLNGLL